MQVLVRLHIPAGKLPAPLLPLDDKVNRPIHLAIQPLRVALLVSLGAPGRRPLDRDTVVVIDPLAILADPHLGIGEQHVHQRLGAARLLPQRRLVVPRVRRAAAVAAQLARHAAAALAHLEAPVQVCGRVALEEELLAEGRGEPLVEPLLVQVEGALKGRRRAREQGRAREDDARLDAVLLRRVALPLERSGRGGDGLRAGGGDEAGLDGGGGRVERALAVQALGADSWVAWTRRGEKGDGLVGNLHAVRSAQQP